MLLLILAANCFSVTSEGVSYCFPPRLTPLLFSLKKKGWHRRAKQRATRELSSQVFKPVRPMSVLISPIVPFQPSWGGVPFLPFFMTCFGDHACYSVHRHSSPFLFCLLYYFVQECLGWRKWQNYVKFSERRSWRFGRDFETPSVSALGISCFCGNFYQLICTLLISGWLITYKMQKHKLQRLWIVWNMLNDFNIFM